MFFLLAFDAADLNQVFAFDAGFFHYHFLIEFTHHLHFLGGDVKFP